MINIKFPHVLALVLLPFVALAQSQNAITNIDTNVYTLTREESASVYKFSVLADKNYTFEQVRNDTTLRFLTVKNDIFPLLYPDSADAYWVKVSVYNPFAYAEKCMASFLPMTDNTLYYYDENEKKWRTCRNGLHVNNGQRNIWSLPCTLQAHDTTVLYIKADITAFRSSTICPCPARSAWRM